MVSISDIFSRAFLTCLHMPLTKGHGSVSAELSSSAHQNQKLYTMKLLTGVESATHESIVSRVERDDLHHVLFDREDTLCRL